MRRSRKVLFLMFCLFPFALRGQINTDRVMLMGRNALYYEDYVLSIQRFNMVISAKPYLAEPLFLPRTGQVLSGRLCRSGRRLYFGRRPESVPTRQLQASGALQNQSATVCRCHCRL